MFKNINKNFTVIFFAFLAIGHAFAGKLDDALKSFEDNPGYSSPIATYMGTLQNTGWVHSAKVSKGFSIGYGLDFQIAFLAQGDVTYDWNRQTNCQTIKDQYADQSSYTLVGECDNTETRNVPTIFGGSSNTLMTQYQVTGIDANTGRIEADPSINVSDGLFANSSVEFLNQLLFLPLAYINMGYEHTQAKFRFLYLPLPEIDGHKVSMGFYGLGIQHDVNRFLKDFDLPVDFSVLGTWSFWNLGYKPKDWEGELTLNGLAHQYSVVVGKTWGLFELTSEIGYELSSFDAGGSLTKTDSEGQVETISPNSTITGRNGFKVAINATLNFGSYKLFGAQSIGAQRGNTINFINYQHNGAK